MQAQLINRYIWLISTIAGAGKISKDEIDRRWSSSAINEEHEQEYPRRSFLRHKDDIEEIFGIHIGYKRLTNTYYIANSDDMRSDNVRQWIMNSFAINNALTESQSLHSRILVEEIPAGTEYLPIILAAMRSNHKLLVLHSRFGQDAHEIKLDPYCLKVFKQRWYVYGRPSDHPKERRIYALDRISSLQELPETFHLPVLFDAETEFAGYYGVFTDRRPERVRVRVITKGANFLRTLPLHHSQKEVLQNDDYSEFEYLVAPTFDFIQQLKTFGSQLMVIKPQWLHDELLAEAQQMVQMYSTNK